MSGCPYCRRKRPQYKYVADHVRVSVLRGRWGVPFCCVEQLADDGSHVVAAMGFGASFCPFCGCDLRMKECDGVRKE